MYATTLHDNLQKLLRMDFCALLFQILLLAAGLLFIRNAGMEYGGPPSKRWLIQTAWIFLGTIVYFSTALADYRHLAKYSPYFYGAGILLLLLVLLCGSYVNGAKCVLKLQEGMVIQVSEPVKPLVVLCTAWVLSQQALHYSRIPPMFIWCALVLPPFLLILLEPDCGTAIVYLPCTFFILFLNHFSKKSFLLLFLAIACAMPILYQALKPYQKLRIFVFCRPILEGTIRFLESRHPEKAAQFENALSGEIAKLGNLKTAPPVPSSDGSKRAFQEPIFKNLDKYEVDDWNAKQAIYTVGSGGFTGIGYGRGIQHTLGFLPRFVAPTDFIFSVIAEESGFCGCTLILLMLLCIILLACRTAYLAADPLGTSLAGAASVLYATHTIINVGMNLGWMPIIGIPLPFVSYGGSFLLGTMAVAGLIQSVHIHTPRPSETVS